MRKNAVDAEVRLYDNLFTVEDPNADNFLELLNPDSLKVLKGCKVEPGPQRREAGRELPVHAPGLLLRG